VEETARLGGSGRKNLGKPFDAVITDVAARDESFEFKAAALLRDGGAIGTGHFPRKIPSSRTLRVGLPGFCSPTILPPDPVCARCAARAGRLEDGQLNRCWHWRTERPRSN